MAGSIFGGTIFSATDPFLAILYWTYFKKRNIDITIWVKSADIKFIKPAYSDLTIDFKISLEDIQKAENCIKENRIFEHWHEVFIKSKDDLVAKGNIHIYLKNK